jgi:two-component system NtrC family sensor kinase
MTDSLRQKPKRSLRWILAVWFLSFAIVPIIFLTVYSLRKFQQTVDNELVLRLKGNASEIQVILGEYQKALAHLQRIYINDLNLKSHLRRNHAALIENQIHGWLSESTASSLAVYNKRGDLLVENKKNSATPEKDIAPSTTQKITSLHQNFRSQLARKEIVYAPDYSAGQRLGLAIMSPIYSGQTILGYFKQTLYLDAHFLSRISERMQIQGILLEPNGRIIVGSHPDFLLFKSDFFSEFLKIPNLKAISLALRGEPFGFIFSKITWGESGFKIVLAASKKESNIAIDNLRVAYYTILAIMFGVLALSVVAASNVVLRPLSELVEAIQDLHLGENIIELPIKNDNEVGQLTTSFNDLSRRILAAQRELKDKITELEESNRHLKETQAQLVHSAKMASLGQLVAGVAHELNNPIGFIFSNMTHLREYSQKLIALVDIAENDPSKIGPLKKELDLEYIRKDLPKLISSCEEGARRTKEIVIGLRNFSRIEEKSYKPIDLHESIDTTLNLLSGEFKNRIEVKKDYAEIPLITCNQTQINQVFMNILSNAAQAISGSGVVWISTKLLGAEGESPSMVGISIQDNGPGVSSEVLQKIFDPFFTTKGVGQGTGLGLAISYGIISSHGGTIKVTSKVGKGTEFLIALPIEPSRQEKEVG